MDAASSVAQFTDLNLLSLSLRFGSFTCELLNWGFFEPLWWRNYLHVHSFFEVCYVYQGLGTFRINDQICPVQSGDVFVARPGEAHEIISSHEEPLGIYFWAYTLLPGEQRGDEQSGVDVVMGAFLASRQAISARTPSMLRTLQLLSEEVTRKEPGYLQAIEALTVKLLLDTARAVVDLSRLSVPLDLPAKRSDEAIVQVMVRYLRDNYSRCSLSVCDLAAQVHLSERHASRLFHQVMGTTIKAYLTTLRMEKAAQLLLDGRTSIKEVALATGYPDVRYFTTLFHQRVGLPPASFQRKGGTRFLVNVQE